MQEKPKKLIRMRLAILYSKPEEAKAFVDEFAVIRNDRSEYHVLGPGRETGRVSNWGLSHISGGIKIGKDRMEIGIELEIWSKEADLAINLERIKARAVLIVNEQINIRNEMLKTLDLLNNIENPPDSPARTIEEIG